MKKEIENYLHKDAIVSAYQELGIQLTIATNFNDFEDVPRKVAQLVHEASESQRTWDELTDEQRDEKESKAKRVLCSRATKYMTVKLLSEVDPNGDLIEWLQDMNELTDE